MDSSVVPCKRAPELFQVTTTDFFYPSVDDPYMEGKIACANVLSDLYAMGVCHCDNMLMILGVCRRMDEHEQQIVTSELIRGFNDQATLAKTKVTGGQTVMNPWPMCGGVAMAVCRREDMIMPEDAAAGNLIVLTKPLGTQVLSNVHVWRCEQSDAWQRISGVITLEEELEAYELAMLSMARLNRKAAKIMRRHGATAMTDVTGFGLLGHASNLAQNQKATVDFEIHTLPIILKMREVGELCPYFRLMQGYSAETSGGLFACVPAENAVRVCDELMASEGQPAWIIGRVVEGTRTARVLEDARVLEVRRPISSACETRPQQQQQHP
eukprot:gnl/Spiro4/1677_TR881_c0_g1_i1.p1 gnl/Spiro4/1677_TR881_c0_g1~~gnl/Spiro4/1677_TR881_c0_g1_i1.p1  ORF type:complete len:326 (-),score=63.59 gnl/Spiro4/1677_TR881_c0_g1_i1:198-1175(-)